MAKLDVLTGHLTDAVAWSRRSGLAMSDELSYVREFEHMTFARVLLAQAIDNGSALDMDAIIEFIGRLLRAATDGGRGRSVIEILILQVLASEAAGDRGGAVRSLERALALAEPEGHVAVFLDERAVLDPLLRRIDARRPSAEQARKVLTALRPERASQPRQPLVDPLTDRELEVLRLLDSDSSGPDIARRLYVSLNTLRTHTKSIYSKLGVDSRRTAVRRAAELGLLSQSRTRR